MTASEQRASELEEEFSYDGYQVVRKEFFAHLRDPAVIIRRDSISFNTACIKGLEGTVYVQFLISPDSKRFAVRSCDRDDKDAIRWCIEKDNNRKSRSITCRVFSEKLYKTMGWDLGKRYKIQGYRINHDGETLFIFDLSETEIFVDERGTKKKNEAPAGGSENKVTRREASLPAEWLGTFGVPVAEHASALDISENEDLSEVEALVRAGGTDNERKQ